MVALPKAKVQRHGTSFGSLWSIGTGRRLEYEMDRMTTQWGSSNAMFPQFHPTG